MSTKETIFKQIIQHKIAADIVYQDKRITAFRDIAPRAPTHILIVPNKIIPTLDDMQEEDSELLGYMVFTAAKIARQQKISSSGYRLIINCNQDAGQEIFHIHLHLLGGCPLGPMLITQNS